MKHSMFIAFGACVAMACSSAAPDATTPKEGLTTRYSERVGVKTDKPAADVLRTGVFGDGYVVKATMEWNVSGGLVAFNPRDGRGARVVVAPKSEPSLQDANDLAHGLWLTYQADAPAPSAPQAKAGNVKPQCTAYDAFTDCDSLWPGAPDMP